MVLAPPFGCTNPCRHRSYWYHIIYMSLFFLDRHGKVLIIIWPFVYKRVLCNPPFIYLVEPTLQTVRRSFAFATPSSRNRMTEKVYCNDLLR
ncbi:hypothetical protein FIBSPDRAFT_51584 [Athelia psychrophila]|uniref:Uncharacterized protein n=1 Tax=Athelia psychrophila TaxID=1759441 RepID=A0A166FGX0_9AGAM|nr:hypothetical protein FIBSPDRAFT_51584 [Fibularhizoctonia sp. CBS 109695]